MAIALLAVHPATPGVIAAQGFHSGVLNQAAHLHTQLQQQPKLDLSNHTATLLYVTNPQAA
jgi:hypothetical protein